MFDIERARASWARETAEIDAVVLPMSAEAAAKPVREDGWTVHDLLGHIASRAQIFIQFIRTQELPQISGKFNIDDLNEQHRKQHEQHPWPEVQAYWQQVRDDITSFLASSTNALGEQPAKLPWRPDTQTAGDVLRLMILHTRAHREELVRGTAVPVEE